MTPREEQISAREALLSQLSPEQQAWLRVAYAHEDAYAASAQGISDSLRYYGDCLFTETGIVRTIHRLLPDVREFTLEQCIFLSVGQAAAGMVLPGRIADTDWIIILDEREFNDPTEEEEGLSLVAHEIAHAWLKHDRLSLDWPDECEVAAANLVGQWGFTGRGIDPNFCDTGKRQQQSVVRGL